MRNLLLQKEKKDLALRYRLRFCTVVLLALSCCGLAFSALIFPSYLLSSSKERVAESRYKTVLATVAAASDDKVSAELNRFVGRLGLIRTTTNVISITEVVETLLFYRPTSIAFSTLSFSEETSATRNLVLLGIASDRNALLQFSKKLEKEKRFSSVILPVSNFQKNKDIEFALNISIRQPEKEKIDQPAQ